MKVIAVHLDRCTGCKTCELYCAVERSSNGKTLLKAVRENPLPQARVRVEGSTDVPVALQCRQCLKAPCLDACLTGALIRDVQSGLVIIDEKNCIGCWTCTLFCPFGVIYPWPERKIALKCDRCLHMEVPVCIDVCPTKALELVEVSDFEMLLREKRQKTAKLIALHGTTAGTLLLDMVEPHRNKEYELSR